MSDLGTYVEHDGRPAVRFERTYLHPVERVWRAITEPAEVSTWFPSSMQIEPRVGGRVTYTGNPYAADSEGTVLTYDPPHALAMTWDTDELHFRLEPVGAGACRLVLVNVLSDSSAAARNASGWYVCLDQLDRTVAGRPGRGPHGEDAEAAAPWNSVYAAHVATGLPEGAEVPDPIELG